MRGDRLFVTGLALSPVRMNCQAAIRSSMLTPFGLNRVSVCFARAKFSERQVTTIMPPDLLMWRLATPTLPNSRTSLDISPPFAFVTGSSDR